MDYNSLLMFNLINKTEKEYGFVALVLMIIILPYIKLQSINDLLHKYVWKENILYRYIITGTTSKGLSSSGTYAIRNMTHFPNEYIYVSYYLYNNNIANNFLKAEDKIIAASLKKTKLNNDISMEIINRRIDDNKGIGYNSTENLAYDMYLYSAKSIHDVEEFVNKCHKEYDLYIKNKNNNKLFHFVFKKVIDGQPQFEINTLCDMNDDKCQNYETFDNIYSNNVAILKNDLNKLKDIEYYKKFGLRRKKSYLFHGKPGTGKTSCVVAMSNYDKRHILEIPISRVKTNADLYAIFNIKNINGISITNEQIIILFDEFDIKNHALDHEKKENIAKSNKDSDINQKLMDMYLDPLNIGTMLSKIDGVGNYNGLVIVATTNNYDIIPENLKRDGRLTSMQFGYATTNDMIAMLEKRLNVELNIDHKKTISTLHEKLPHSTIQRVIELYKNTDDVINELIKRSNSDELYVDDE